MMADKLGLGPEVRELKLGSSFTNPKTTGFHTLRYDFKPASVDINQMATLDVGTNSQVTVTIPPNTVFKGSAKPYQKQCIVIINRETNEITLEKLSCNFQVKKTRSEGRKMPTSAPSIPTIDQFTKNKKTAPKVNSNNKGPSKNETKSKNKPQHLAASLGSVVPKHSPLHASPNRKSPNPGVRLSPNNQSSTSASLPVLGFGFDDSFADEKIGFPKDRPAPFNRNNLVKKDFKNNMPKPDSDISRLKPVKEDIGKLSDSSSSSSSSSSSDSSDSSDSEPPAPKKTSKPALPPQSSSLPSMPENLLNEDLQLSSESGSEY